MPLYNSNQDRKTYLPNAHGYLTHIISTTQCQVAFWTSITWGKEMEDIRKSNIFIPQLNQINNLKRNLPVSTES